MPILVASIIGALVQAAGSLVGRVMIALGLGFASYVGFNALVGTITGQITGLISDFGSSDLVGWAGFFQIDKHFSMVLSAITVKITLNGLQDGVKNIVRK